MKEIVWTNILGSFKQAQGYFEGANWHITIEFDDTTKMFHADFDGLVIQELFDGAAYFVGISPMLAKRAEVLAVYPNYSDAQKVAESIIEAGRHGESFITLPPTITLQAFAQKFAFSYEQGEEYDCDETALTPEFIRQMAQKK